jgi:peptidyl-prolyl cis-trans isomerase C
MRGVAALGSVLLAGWVLAEAPGAVAVLRVNGVAIKAAELNRVRSGIEGRMPAGAKDPNLILRHAVDQIIGHRMMVEAARDANIKVTRPEVEAVIARKRAGFANAEAFKKALADAEITVDEMERDEEERLLVQRFVTNQLTPLAAPSQPEMKSYYEANPKEFEHPEQARLRMILCQVQAGGGEQADAAARGRAAEAARRLKAGEDFAKLVAEFSDDTSKAKGGDLGWVRSGLLLEELETATATLKPGQFTEPIKTKYGYHILRVDERRGAGISAWDEIKGPLSEFIKTKNIREMTLKIVTERRAKAKIEALDPTLKALLDAGGAARP